jgi:probable HAF family extracellular repeat protein
MSADGTAISGIYASGLAFRWTRSGGQEFFAGAFSEATGISGDGNVVVGRGINAASGNYAFRWTSAGGLTNLGSLPGTTIAEAYGTNGDGSVVVGSSYDTGFSSSTAFRWTAAGGMQSLGTLPGETSSGASGVSADGNTIVGKGAAFASVFRWTSAGGMSRLPGLPGDLGVYPAYNSPVSADGRFVAGTGDFSPIRWDASGTAHALGLPAGAFDLAEANAISGDGSTVVGTAYLSNGSQTPYYWTAATGPVDLTAYLTSLGIDLTGFTLTDAQNCSFDGTTIVAYGRFGFTEGSIVISNIPAPSAAAVLGLAGLVAARRRRGACAV